MAQIGSLTGDLPDKQFERLLDAGCALRSDIIEIELLPDGWRRCEAGDVGYIVLPDATEIAFECNNESALRQAVDLAFERLRVSSRELVR